VQHREDHVDLGERRADRTPRFQHGEPAGGRVADQRDGGPAGDLGQPPVDDREPLVRIGQHPAPVGRDADRDDVVAVGVEGGDDAPRGDARDRVLRAAAPEDDRHPHPAASAAHPERQ
jgi:hypothetical protein